jgi:hypothetical protein
MASLLPLFCLSLEGRPPPGLSEAVNAYQGQEFWFIAVDVQVSIIVLTLHHERLNSLLSLLDELALEPPLPITLTRQSKAVACEIRVQRSLRVSDPHINGDIHGLSRPPTTHSGNAASVLHRCGCIVGNVTSEDERIREVGLATPVGADHHREWRKVD